MTNVKAWEETVSIPTYGIGKPEKNPMFFEKRVYQGSSGAVYPYPVIEKISDIREPRNYHAVFLENEYVKIMILPELGGRVQMAYDKIKQRHFVYYNRVIKPALVGLTGPWISGGIEFNWPQHHRPSTFLPVDFKIEEFEDGSVTVWVSEEERMSHQKGMAGFTLRPGCAFLEIKGQLYNPTSIPQTFLWWANPAVAVNEHYQSVFPTDVNAVFDHGKRDVSKYPIATGTYYKVDYSAGVDISRYKNLPVPTSYMAIKSNYDFVGGYENDTQAGLLHVANHHISPGKKQWTWGHGDFGKAWDRNLTDSDGPYIELMTGVYTDNQPDFSWLQPYEEKQFTQYFIPYREVGTVKNATRFLLMNIEECNDCPQNAILSLFATKKLEQIRTKVFREGEVIADLTVDLDPKHPLKETILGVSVEDVEVRIYDSTGLLMLEWKAEPAEIKPIPEAVKPAKKPEEVDSTEQLFLTGIHLEQYRHATYHATDYYLEALRRDPKDVRNNNAMGLWMLRKGRFELAEDFLRRAISTLTERNPNPYDGEPFYNLGLSLKYQQKVQEAYEAFYKATWNAAWQDAAYYALAELSCMNGTFDTALCEVNRSLTRNWSNHRARHLKTFILRILNQSQEAIRMVDESLKMDRFNFGCYFENYLLTNKKDDLSLFIQLMRQDSRNYENLCSAYAQFGAFYEANVVIDLALEYLSEPSVMLYYYKASYLSQLGDIEGALNAVGKAEEIADCEFFPNSLDALSVLQCVDQLTIESPFASYLLGNIWYDKRQYGKALECWEKSASMNDSFPPVLRNLSLAYFNKWNQKEKAVALLENAFYLDETDSRILMELDQLYKKINKTPDERLKFLQRYKPVVDQRDDLYLEYVTLLNLTRQYRTAIEAIDARKFHPWEGGEGKVSFQYQYARIKLAQECLNGQLYEEALKLLQECLVFPPHLGEGRLYGARDNDILYYMGCALEGLGREHDAKEAFQKAIAGDYTPSMAMYYNDGSSDKIYYQGLAFLKLGNVEKANSCFNKLVSYGEKHLYDVFEMDYFAVSLPDLQIWEEDMNKVQKMNNFYLLALGHLGLGDYRKSHDYFTQIAELNKSFLTTARLDNMR